MQCMLKMDAGAVVKMMVGGIRRRGYIGPLPALASAGPRTSI